MPGFPILHCFLEFVQTHAHQISDAIQPPHPLWSLCPPAFNLSQHQGLFVIYICNTCINFHCDDQLLDCWLKMIKIYVYRFKQIKIEIWKVSFTGELEEHLDWFQVFKSGFRHSVMLLTASCNLWVIKSNLCSEGSQMAETTLCPCPLLKQFYYCNLFLFHYCYV